MSLLIASGTYAMNWFSTCFRFLQFISESAPSKVLKIIALLLSFPCFKASHFFFKIVYSLNQRRLRSLCGEDVFLKFYDRRVATDSIVNIFQSLRHIESGIKGAEAHYGFTKHGTPTRYQSSDGQS